MAYINNELEEMGREEFFRIKKILAVKYKKKTKDCPHTVRTDGCPSCKTKFKEIEEDNCLVCGMTISVFPKIEPIAEEDEMASDKGLKKTESNILDAFKTHITDIIEITEEMKGRGIRSESVDKFLKTASALRDRLNNKKSKDVDETEAAGEVERIASDVSIHKLCDMCIKRYEDEQAAAGAKLERVREDEADAKKEEAKLAIKKEQDQEVDLELGVFETEYQQITKITRVKKEDGTITEEKRVIKTKKETRAPQKPPDKKDDQGGNMACQGSASSSKSTPYGCGSRTTGMVLIKDGSKFKPRRSVDRKAQSETLLHVSSLTSPVVRYCMSSASMMSTSDDCGFCCATQVENNDENNEHSESALKEIYASSFEFEETIHSFGQSMTSEDSESDIIKVHLKTD